MPYPQRAAPIPPPTPRPGAPAVFDLGGWRAQLIDRVALVCALVSVIPCLLLSIDALRSGRWLHGLLLWAGVAVLVAMGVRSRLPYPVRGSASVLVMFGLGLWLLCHGSAVSLLFMLACPLMCLLAVGPHAAFAALAVCCLTLTGTGWWLQLPFPVSSGVAGGSLLRWLLIGANLLVLGLLLTLSCAFLLRRLDQSLQRQEEAVDGLRHSETLLQDVTSQIPGMVFRMRLSEGAPPQFLYVSPGSQDLFGLAPQALKTDWTLLLDLLHPDDRRELLVTAPPGQAGTIRHDAQLRLPGADGQMRWLQMQATEVERAEGAVVLNGVMTDITDQKAAEQEVWRQAHFDSLTGLPNRLLLQRELSQALCRCGNSGGLLALLMVDLDRFKDVNDTLGHSGGDQLLIQAARRLQACLREGDLVARMGGDEFMLLLPTLERAEDADAVGQRVLDALMVPFDLTSESAFLSASVGIALHPLDSSNADDLLKHADQAMYRAKDSGRNRLCRFSPEMHAEAQQRLRLCIDLRSAIALGQLSVVYQPIIDLKTGAVTKAEALLRWQHPELGPVSPGVFIPIAESIGLIGEIGEWVFQTAAQQVQHWRRTLDPGFTISVNRSPLQFRGDHALAGSWPAQLAQRGLPGDAILVEVTESLLLDSGDQVHKQLQGFRRAGMQVALDDFGTGYSALSYLYRYELDLLKIDRSFVSGPGSGTTGRALCRTMVVMAHELGMKVVAEGVETEEQHQWLLDLGCDFAQGWHFGRPMSADAFERVWHQAAAVH